MSRETDYKRLTREPLAQIRSCLPAPEEGQRQQTPTAAAALGSKALCRPALLPKLWPLLSFPALPPLAGPEPGPQPLRRGAADPRACDPGHKEAARPRPPPSGGGGRAAGRPHARARRAHTQTPAGRLLLPGLRRILGI